MQNSHIPGEETDPFTILFLGDIVGRPGRIAVRNHLDGLQLKWKLNFVIANGENASGGLGLDPDNACELHDWGLDVITSGNHIWKHRTVYPLLDKAPWLLRPANYPPGAPGRGYNRFEIDPQTTVSVINLIGRTYMEQVDCPFRFADEILEQIPKTDIVLVDFHAEATSEKKAMGYHLQGRVSAVIGTHTHIQTNDSCIMEGGTAYITDAGMCGPEDSILGMDPEIIVRRFKSGLPERFKLAKGTAGLQGALIEVDRETAKAISISPVRWSSESDH